MHRAVCRFIRGTCGKYGTREPTLATEEVHKKRQEKNEDFVPKNNFADALGWGTGLFLTYDFIHNRHKYICPYSSSKRSQINLNDLDIDDTQSQPTTSTTANDTVSTAKPKTRFIYDFDFKHYTCLFTLFGGLTALGQPQLSTATYVKTQQRQYHHHHHQLQKKKSIDRTPFLKESLLSTDEQENNKSDNLYSNNFSITSYEYEGSASRSSSSVSSLGHDFGDDDDIIFLKEEYKKGPFVSSTKIKDPDTLRKAEEYAGNLLSLLGGFKFLNYYKDKDPEPADPSDPPSHALEILKMGSELGSSRSLYNLGVAYDRLNDQVLARDYYKRAADLGHPLATFNTAIFKLRDGQVNEAIEFLQYAAKYDVAEAKSILEEIAK